MPRPFFHKLILPNTLQDKKLRIPDNFLRKLGNDFPPFVRLTVPGGPVWPIGLIKVEDKFWFHDGWQEFVERYAIRVGYFLVFRYEGNGVFNVHIFNLSASEINYQSNAISGRRFIIFEDMEDDETLENFSASRFDHLKRNTNLSTAANIYHSVTLPKREMSAQHSSLDSKSTPDDVKLSSDETPVKQPKKRGRKKIKVNPNEQPSSGQNEDDTEMRNRFYESASARKRTVTSEERERAVNAAKAFEPVNPFCRVVLRPSYLYRGCIMYLPSCFAEKHLNGVSGFIKLQFSNGKQWPVRCLYRGGRAKLSQGWYEFSLENNLGEGDVCVFELLKSRDIVLKVTVFRVLEDGGLMNSQ